MTPRDRICQQLGVLDDELLGAVERVVDAFAMMIKLRGETTSEAILEDPREATPREEDAHEEFDLEASLDPAAFHDDAADAGTIRRAYTFRCGDEVEVTLPDPIGLKVGVFVAVDASGQYRINLGGGISKAFPPEDVKRRRR